jgi:hypothetical protein
MVNYTILAILLTGPQPEQTLSQINKLLQKHSPYGGYIEIVDNQIIHHQQKNPGTRIMKLEDLQTIRQKTDRYDPNGAYYNVELVCEHENCVRIEWVDGYTNYFATLVFGFQSEKSAEKARNLFEQLLSSLN